MHEKVNLIINYIHQSDIIMWFGENFEIWEYNGIKKRHAEKWINNGFDVIEAKKWLKYGFNLESAKKYYLEGKTPSEARDLILDELRKQPFIF